MQMHVICFTLSFVPLHEKKCSWPREMFLSRYIISKSKRTHPKDIMGKFRKTCDREGVK